MPAFYRQGNTLMLDYTPGAAVAAGDVVVVSEEPRIAHLDIAAGDLGALAAPSGTVVYLADKTIGAGSGWADGDIIYWDAVNDLLIDNSGAGANKKIGYAVGVAADADTTALFRHST